MLAERLAEFALHACPEAAALERMRLSLFDWAVCALAGQGTDVARAVRALARQEGGATQAGLLGSASRVPVRMAALANGAAGHALDCDDTHFAHIGHPSAAVVPAALAVAEQAGAGGRALLEAALVGAEASVRVGLWLGRAHYQAGFHQTATAGAFGACLAVARLLGLGPAGTAQALGLLASRASGLKVQFGSMGKPLNAGIAAANGVEAVLLARAGLRSVPEALEGAQGFGATHAGEGNVGAFESLGTCWLMRDVRYKFHACCHGLHAMLEALAAVVPAGGVRPGRLIGLEISAHPRWATVCDIAAPEDGLQCKFSFRQVAAMLLAGRDTAQPESYSDAAARDPLLAGLRERVRVEFDGELPEWAAEVRLRMAGAAVRRARHDLSAPVAPDVLAARLRGKARAFLGAARAEALEAAVLSGPAPEMAALLRILFPAEG